MKVNQFVWGHTTTSKCNANGHRKINFEHGIRHACAAPTHTHKKNAISARQSIRSCQTKYNASKAMNMLVVTTNSNTIARINVFLNTTKSPRTQHATRAGHTANMWIRRAVVGVLLLFCVHDMLHIWRGVVRFCFCVLYTAFARAMKATTPHTPSKYTTQAAIYQKLSNLHGFVFFARFTPGYNSYSPPLQNTPGFVTLTTLWTAVSQSERGEKLVVRSRTKKW